MKILILNKKNTVSIRKCITFPLNDDNLVLFSGSIFKQQTNIYFSSTLTHFKNENSLCETLKFIFLVDIGKMFRCFFFISMQRS